ncbi:MAG: phage holin family protein [Eubacteriales bacterium]
MEKQIIKLSINILVLYASTFIFPSVYMESVATLAVAGLILWVINLFIRPAVLFISLPVNLLTIGLFTLIINTWMVLITDTFITGFKIPNFSTAFIIALLISLGNILIKKKNH